MAKARRNKNEQVVDHSGSGQRVLPAKAEAALREAGVWDEQFEHDLAMLDAPTFGAISVFGAWDDLDWEEAEAALYEIRHRNPPSPPVELQ